jgi:hypothetical protein
MLKHDRDRVYHGHAIDHNGDVSVNIRDCHSSQATANIGRYIATNPINGFNGVAALLRPNGALWVLGINAQSSFGCLIADVTSCAAGQASGGNANLVLYNGNTAALPDYAVGNANCGAWNLASP